MTTLSIWEGIETFLGATKKNACPVSALVEYLGIWPATYFGVTSQIAAKKLQEPGEGWVVD